MLFRCSHLRKDFRSGRNSIRALADVSLETREGEFLAIVGPSGCGKTTLLRILAGLIRPTSGKVERVPSPGEDGLRALVVFQEKGLFPWMTALDNAAFGLQMQGIAKQERYRRAGELLRRLGLRGRERAYPNQLSAGMKQRVSLIRSFISRPSALLMDEPFAALDYQTRLVLQQELLELWGQNRTSVVFVTHDIEEAILLSDRVIVMGPQPSRVLATLSVALPRPRDPTLTAHEAFTDLKLRILEKLSFRINAAEGVTPGSGAITGR